MITNEGKLRFIDYCNSHHLVFSDRVVLNFFQEEQNVLLLLLAINGDMKAQGELEDSFRKYFFRIRFIKFLISTIKFCTIDQLRLNQKKDQRNQLIFDRPLSEE